jgi:SAM-dependent methyltransferase
VKLNLGCGQDILPGYVNLDAVALPGVDVVHDLDVFPWPFGDQEFDLVQAFDVFEHVNDPVGFMLECYRVLAPGGGLVMHTSYWKTENSYTDPTHKRFCTERTFDYWCPGTDYYKRYGLAYARGGTCAFEKVHIAPDGQELSVVLRRI